MAQQMLKQHNKTVDRIKRIFQKKLVETVKFILEIWMLYLLGYEHDVK